MPVPNRYTKETTNITNTNHAGMFSFIKSLVDVIANDNIAIINATFFINAS